MSQPFAGDNRRIFHTLDGLRGVAAITVVVYHFSRYAGAFRFPSAYLAVDLFFMMSGVVIAHGYEQKLLSGMSVRRFIALRVGRLYPVYILQFVFAIALSLVAWARHPLSQPWSGWEFGGIAVMNLLMLPSLPRSGEAVPLFPLNLACWSLFWEMVINIVYAALVRHLGNRVLFYIAATSGALLVLLAMLLGNLDGGAYWENFFGGPVRVTFSFAVGVVLYRWYVQGRRFAFKIPAPLLLLAALALLTIDISGHGRVWFDVLAVTIGFPAIAFAAIDTEPFRARRAYTLLGVVSYPLYVVHEPSFLIANSALLALGLAPAVHAPYSGLFMVLVALLLAIVVAARYEPGARKLLGRALSGIG